MKPIHLELPIPPSVNRTYKTGNGRFYKSPAAKAWHDEAQWLIVSQAGKPLIREAVKVDTVFHFNRDRDIDNGLKALHDALIGVVIEDDRQIYQASQSKRTGVADPKVVVTIVPLYSPQ